MIHIHKLKKAYGEQFALTMEELQIAEGSITGIVGNNGAGKTTLFRLILDLIEPTSGEVFIDNEPVRANDSWKSFTGSYLDEGFLIDFLKPEEYFYFTGKLYGMDEQATDQRLSIYTRFMAGEVLGQDKFIRDMSSGNRQKTGIVAAMMVEPRLLILDEPFNYLDPSSQIWIKRLLKEDNEARKTTMLISSHNLTHLAEICNRIVLLERGRVIKDLSLPADDPAEVERYFSMQAE
ncbi:MAG: ABC transporter ATP-binding protein [Bacteroidia bacterium]|nr:MAG: ABC transporter ATP-binding protein [Bacteroidia bacterium]